MEILTHASRQYKYLLLIVFQLLQAVTSAEFVAGNSVTTSVAGMTEMAAILAQAVKNEPEDMTVGGGMHTRRPSGGAGAAAADELHAAG